MGIKIFLLIPLLILISLGAGCSSSDPIDRLIPDEALNGAIQNVKPVRIEEQRGKSVNGGFLIKAQVIVPFDIKREQVKPTLLAAIKTLKNKYSNCEWIVVALSLQESLDKYTLYAGRAEYTRDGIDVTYWIPSLKQLSDQKDLRKKENRDDPILAGLDFSDWEPIRPLTREEFNFATLAASTSLAFKKAIQDDVLAASMKNGGNYTNTYRKGMENIEDRVLVLTAKKLGRKKAEAKRAQRQLGLYYNPGWGTEKIAAR